MMSGSSKIDQASNKLEDAFNRSKAVFFEEAQTILRDTIGPSPSTSRGQGKISIQMAIQSFLGGGEGHLH